MNKSTLYLITLSCFLYGSVFGQELSIINGTTVNGEFSKREGANNGQSIQVSKEADAYKISLSGEESWAGIYVTASDKKPYDVSNYKYIVMKVKSSKPVVVEKLGYVDDEGKSELIRKLKLDNTWKTIVLELAKDTKELSAPFAFITVGQIDLFVSEVKYTNTIPNDEENLLELISAPFERDEEARYVFNEESETGFLSGYSGEKNGASMLIDDHCMESPYRGKYCIKIEVDNKETWRALFLQASGKWTATIAEDTELPDLSEYKKLVFYARSPNKDYYIPEVGFGAESNTFSQEPRNIVFVTISKKWRRYEIDLKGLDRSSVNDVMMFVLEEGTLFLDEMRFEK